MAIVLYLLLGIVGGFSFQGMMENKGCNDPALAMGMVKMLMSVDLVSKIMLLPFVDSLGFEGYAMLCFSIDFGIIIYGMVQYSLHIQKYNVRKNRKFPSETNYTNCGRKTVVWCLISLVISNIILFSLRLESVSASGRESADFDILMCDIMLLVCVYFLYMSFVRLDRLKEPSRRSLYALDKNNSPITLLRSFQIDATPAWNGKTFDEALSETIDLHQHPILSLANPDEVLPSGGSLKIQAKDDEWKEVVKQVLHHSRAVILVEGKSEGLQWEISKLKEYVNPKQVFVLIPSNYYRLLAWCLKDDQKIMFFSISKNLNGILQKVFNRRGCNKILRGVWADFRQLLNCFEINVPVDFPGDNCLISFNEQWNGSVVVRSSEIKHMMDYIIHQTRNYNSPDFDYSALGKKVASHEVNEFLKQEDIKEFIVASEKIKKIGYKVAAVVAVIGLFSWLFL